GIFFAFVFNRALDGNLRRAQVPAAVVETVESQRSMLAAIALPAEVPAEVKASARHAITDAFVTAFRWISLLGALLAAASAVIAWIFVEGAGRRRTGRSR